MLAATVFTGGVATTPVCNDVTDALPDAFVPVSTTRMVAPASPLASTYVVAVAPEISAQLLPAASQRCHWCVSVGAGFPLHVPAFAVSVWPTTAVPLIVGSTVFDGATGASATVVVCVDVAEALPALFVPVTTTLIVAPMSATANEYVDPVAPTMSAQLAPDTSQRRH